MSLASVKKEISLAIKARKRETGLGVRKAAEKCDLDASTLSRLERGDYATLPDAATLQKLANWVGTSVEQLMGGSASVFGNLESNTVPEILEVHLRADKNLSEDTATALSQMFKALYLQATANPKDKT